MNAFVSLLRRNRNYRNTWIGQIVSEAGDHFNNIAVFSLAVATTRSGLVVSGVMLARAIPAIMVGPLAGVALDRFDRKRVMIASDLVRAVVAMGFIFTVHRHDTWLLYVLSALLMLASPFFTSGRAGHSAGHRHRRGAAHRQLADPDHAMDHADHRHFSGRRQRDAVRLPVGVLRQLRSRSWFRPSASRGCSWRAADSARRAGPSPRPKWCGRGTNMWRGCATCAPCR